MRTFLSLVFLLALMPLARAQEEVPPPTVVATPGDPDAPETTPTKTLFDLLPELRWPARTRGPLLLVAPERVTLSRGVLASARSREGLSLTTLAPLVGHKIERFGNLSVLGPLQVPVMGLPPEMLQMMKSTMRPGAALPLLSVLSEAQWGMAASEGGLGRDSLSSERQRKLWDDMIPPILGFQSNQAFPTGMGADEPISLAPAQVRALRLRVARRLELMIGGVVPLDIHQKEKSFFISAAVDADLFSRQKQMALAMGQGASQLVPYQRKKTDLDPALLDATLSPLGATDISGLTVRIAKATGIALYADRRLGSVPIKIIAEPDQTVRAGDALAALIRATGTAVRRVSAGNESAFVLTSDRIPLAVSSTALNDELLPVFIGMAASARQTGKLPDVWDRLPRPETTLPESLWKQGEDPDVKPIPLSQLPPELAEQARKLGESFTSELEPDGRPSLRKDTVTPRTQAHIELYAPFWSASAELMEIPIGSFRRAPELSPVALPIKPKTRGLHVNLPRTDAERTRLLTLAGERGVNLILVSLSGDTRDDALFASLAREGLSRKIGIVPVLCPLQPAPDDTSLERDLSLTGRSATEMNAGRTLGQLTEIMPPLGALFRQITERDFVSPEAAPVASVARRIAALSALPGVTDITLAELAAPGYDGKGRGDDDFLWSGGATPSARLASLRRDSFDPADITISLMMGATAPPFFEGDEHLSLWNKARQARRDAFLKRLDTALKATGQKSRLWVYPLFVNSGHASNEALSSWQGKLPAVKTPASLRLHEHLGATIESMNTSMSGQPTDDEPNLTRRWLEKLFKEASSESFVLSFSDVSLKDALLLLEAAVAKK